MSTEVTVLDRTRTRDAGVQGVLFTVNPSSTVNGALDVDIDYSRFADAYGGDWASRLRLVSLPTCALTTPSLARCRVQTALTENPNTTEQHLSARLPTTPAPGQQSSGTQRSFVMAATAAPSGGGGSFTATSLSPAGSWSAGGNTGAFGYNYPIAVPPTMGGEAPDIALNYSSSAVDGRTSATNNQASWVGEGWDYDPGYIERQYKSCTDDGHKYSGDLCWGGENATLSLAGHSGVLVPDGANAWRLQNDDASRIEQVNVSASSDYYNGVNAGTYWRVTTADGTQYFFGAEHLPVGAGGDGQDTTTNSAWDVPVYGDDAGEPCHDDSFNSSRCTMGWRWNLDFVVDPHKNLTRYAYATETNRYSAGIDDINTSDDEHTLLTYTRAGRPTTITYGQNLTDYRANLPAASKVTFNTVERCDGSGGFDCTSEIKDDNADHWPDVPFDQICDAAGTCDNYAPTFFTRRALSSISTQIWNQAAATPAYSDVDQYTFNAPQFPNPGDGGEEGKPAPALWLNDISHTGKDTLGGGSATGPLTTSFLGKALPNRVPGITLPNVSAINRHRLSSITTEAGSTTVVTYDESTPCTRSSADEDNSHTRCFPVRWTPIGYDKPQLDWFRIYPVTRVDVNDSPAWGVNASPSHVTTYTYEDPAWHRDDNELTPDDGRTWGEFRGFARVTTSTGASPDPITKTVAQYLQGMDEDYKKNGTEPDAPKSTPTVPTASGDNLVDGNSLSGFNYQTTTYASASGPAQTVTVNHPWQSTKTAVKVRPAAPDLAARFVAVDRVDTRELLSNGTWRVGRVRTSYDDAYGRPTDVDDLGEVDSAGAPVGETTARRCTRTQYADDASRNMVAYGSLTVATAGACTSELGSATLSAVRSYFDNGALGTLTGPGDVTGTQALQRTPATWAGATSATYDSYGRALTRIDSSGQKKTTSYGANTSAQRYLPTAIVVNDYPTATTTWTSTVTQDSARALPLTDTDVNGNTSSMTYDGLGRLTQAWGPNHTKATNPSTPSGKFAYAISRSGFTSSTSSTLRDDNSYNVSIQILDGMMQLRQIQATPPTGASNTRLVTNNAYDSHGWATIKDQAFYNDDSAPNSTPASVTPGSVPGRSSVAFDGRGRSTKNSFYSNGALQWATTTGYLGEDQVDTDPPRGSIATSTITDARGQQVELRDYLAATPTGAFTSLKYAYDAAGRQTKLVGPVSSTAPAALPPTWTTTYDALDEKIAVTDPDVGSTTNSYDQGGRVSSTTTGGVTVGYRYDALARKTLTYLGSDPSKKIASWTYDTASAGRGKSATAVRYASDGTTPTYTQSIVGYTATGQSTGESVTIPAGRYGNTTAITHSTTNTFTRNYDLPNTQKVTNSAASTLLGASETLGMTYNLGGLPIASGGAKSYETNTYYDPVGRVIRAVSAASPKQVVLTYSWDEPTGRLGNFTSNKQDANAAVDNVTYTYDQAGNITSARNRIDGGATAATVDQQCYRYDSLHRLTEAWTSSGATAPADPLSSNPGVLGQCSDNTPDATDTYSGPSRYWNSYTYDVTGNRTQTASRSFTTTNTIAATSTTASAYANSGNAGPHAITSTTTGATTTALTYVAGNTTTTRTSVSGTASPAKDRTMSWNATGQLAQLKVGPSTPTSTSDYDYDPDGNLVAVTATPSQGTKSTVLYLGNDTLTINSGGTTTTATRHYPFPGGATAVRTAAAGSAAVLHFQSSDPQGTATTDVMADTLAVSRRYYDPFGASRGNAGTVFAGNKGFVNGTTDATTELTNLGAREYDPRLGRFMSVDPILDANDPQSLNGYAYSNNDPVNNEDSTGLHLCPSGSNGRQCDGYYDAPDGKPGRPGPKGGGMNCADYGCDSAPAPLRDNGCDVSCQQALEYGYKYGQNGGSGCSNPQAGLAVCMSDMGNAQRAQNEIQANIRMANEIRRLQDPCHGGVLCSLARAAGEITGVTGCSNGHAIDCAAVVPVGKFAKGAEFIWDGARWVVKGSKATAGAVRGHTIAAEYGQLMHKVYDYGPGFTKEFRLPSGRRIDGARESTHEIRELKANNRRQIRNGNKQLKEYLEELNSNLKPGEKPWTGKVVTYDRP